MDKWVDAESCFIHLLFHFLACFINNLFWLNHLIFSSNQPNFVWVFVFWWNTRQLILNKINSWFSFSLNLQIPPFHRWCKCRERFGGKLNTFFFGPFGWIIKVFNFPPKLSGSIFMIHILQIYNSRFNVQTFTSWNLALPFGGKNTVFRLLPYFTFLPKSEFNFLNMEWILNKLVFFSLQCS